MTRTRTIKTASLFAVAALALTGCAGAAGSEPQAAKLTLGIATPFTSWDPTQATEGHLVPTYQSVYDTLIHRAPDGSLEPWLAESWEYDEAQTSLTLDLRDDVTFSDGTELTPEVVVANLDAFRTGTGAASTTLAAVDTVEALDEDTVRLSLSAPDPALLTHLSNAAGFIASGEAVGTEGIATEPVGSGPYTLDVANTVADDHYTFTAREGYWNPEVQDYETIVIRYIPDTTARLNALISGQVDAAVLDPKSAAEAESQGSTIAENAINWRGFVITDRAGSVVPELADVRVRQAINFAIDDESILKEIYGGYGTVTSQIFGTTSEAYDEALDDQYPYDPEKAKQLLAEAGYADGFELPFTYWANFTDAAELPVIVDQLGAIGITATPVAVPGDAEIADVYAGNYGASLINLFQPNTYQTITQALLPDSTWNIQGTEDALVAESTEEIRFAGDADVTESAQALNQHIVDEAWFSPWFRSSVLWGYNADVVNLELQTEQAAPSIYNYSPVR